MAITVKLTENKIDSCTACGKPNYIVGGAGPGIKPNGVDIFEVGACAGVWTTKFCRDCLRDLEAKIAPSASETVAVNTGLLVAAKWALGYLTGHGVGRAESKQNIANLLDAAIKAAR